MNYVISILENELNLKVHSKEKSLKSFLKGDIPIELHRLHLSNLLWKINELERAIKLLKK